MLLEISDIHSYYEKSHILYGVNMSIDEGEIVCLLGRNGVGKSTTLKSIIGLVNPHSGSVQFKGKELAGLKPHQICRLGVGYVPEERRIFPTLTVRENLIMGIKAKQKSTGKKDWDIDKILRQYGAIALLPRCSPQLAVHNWPLQDFIETRGIRHHPEYTGIYHNEAEFLLLPYLKKKSYYSLGFDGYIKKWGKEDPDIRRQFGLKYRFWTVFTENGKWRRLLSRPNLAAGMYFLRFCVGLVFLFKKFFG